MDRCHCEFTTPNSKHSKKTTTQLIDSLLLNIYFESQEHGIVEDSLVLSVNSRALLGSSLSSFFVILWTEFVIADFIENEYQFNLEEADNKSGTN